MASVGATLMTAGKVACDWGAEHIDNGTEVISVLADPGVSYIDVRCFDGDYNESWFGWTACVEIQDSDTCDRYAVSFDLDYGQIDNATERGYYQYIGCHEFGHTSSIGHRGPGPASTCMEDGSGDRFFNDHDDVAINTDYP